MDKCVNVRRPRISTVITYCGKPIQEMTKEELIQVVEHLYKEKEERSARIRKEGEELSKMFERMKEKK